MEIATRTVRTPSGQDLWVDHVVGDGFPVLVHAGSPGSRRLYRPAAEHAARAHGLRLISYDRPGYGDSPVKPRAESQRPGAGSDRRIADAAGEVCAIADALGLAKLAVYAVSGGGPYGLACAAMLPDLVVACCVMASLAPFNAPGLDWAGGWPDEQRQEVSLFFANPLAARAKYRADAAEGYAVMSTAQGWLERWGDAAGKDEAHSHEAAEYLALTVRDSQKHGDDGWWDDWTALLAPWGFGLDSVHVPVQLWTANATRRYR